MNGRGVEMDARTTQEFMSLITWSCSTMKEAKIGTINMDLKMKAVGTLSVCDWSCQRVAMTASNEGCSVID